MGARRAGRPGRLDRPRSRKVWGGEPPLAFHGSTLRFYDPALGAWRSTWIEPVNGQSRRFVGRPVGAEIVLVSDEEEPQRRWRFAEITPRAFTWKAETSHDGGGSWSFDEEMRLTRVETGARPRAR